MVLSVQRQVTDVPQLARTIGLVEASVYGIGLILGAGIYAIIGEAVAETGSSVVVALLLAAGVATLTGLSYAELAARYPKGEGEYLYVWRAFGWKRLAELTALLRVATGVIATAAVALAFGQYLAPFVSVPTVPVAGGLVVAMSLVNFWGIETSARLNIVFTAIEVAGLVMIIVIGLGTWQTVAVTATTNGLTGVVNATFLLFFAYTGFEALVNITEEMETPATTVPRAIGIALVSSTVVYGLVGLSALGVVDASTLGASPAPLATVAQIGWGETAFIGVSVIALFATANTVLILLVSTSRIVYGVSKAEYNSFPARFAQIHPTRQTPVVAIVLVGVVALPFVLVGDLGAVAGLANVALLTVFGLVNLSLLKLRYDGGASTDTYRVPLSVGPFPVTALLGVTTSVGLLGFYLGQRIGVL